MGHAVQYVKEKFESCKIVKYVFESFVYSKLDPHLNILLCPSDTSEIHAWAQHVLASLVVRHDESDYNMWKSVKAERILILKWWITFYYSFMNIRIWHFYISGCSRILCTKLLAWVAMWHFGIWNMHLWLLPRMS